MGDFLRECREKTGKRQKEIAEECGITPSTYCRIENGKQPLHEKDIPKVAAALGINEKEITEIPEPNILPLIKIIIETGCTFVTLEDIIFLQEINHQLDSPMDSNLITELLSRRHGHDQINHQPTNNDS